MRQPKFLVALSWQGLKTKNNNNNIKIKTHTQLFNEIDEMIIKLIIHAWDNLYISKKV